MQKLIGWVDYPVEPGIPIPMKQRPRRYPQLYTMAVGDSFFVPGVNSASLSAYLRVAGCKTGRVFTRRTLTEEGFEGVRVWRTA